MLILNVTVYKRILAHKMFSLALKIQRLDKILLQTN